MEADCTHGCGVTTGLSPPVISLRGKGSQLNLFVFVKEHLWHSCLFMYHFRQAWLHEDAAPKTHGQTGQTETDARITRLNSVRVFSLQSYSARRWSNPPPSRFPCLSCRCLSALPARCHPDKRTSDWVKVLTDSFKTPSFLTSTQQTAACERLCCDHPRWGLFCSVCGLRGCSVSPGIEGRPYMAGRDAHYSPLFQCTWEKDKFWISDQNSGLQLNRNPFNVTKHATFLLRYFITWLCCLESDIILICPTRGLICGWTYGQLMSFLQPINGFEVLVVGRWYSDKVQLGTEDGAVI